MMSKAEDLPPMPSLKTAFLYWLKLGFISFGGPAGQIALLHQDLVVEKRWISEQRFLHALNYCMVLPGPEAQQLVTYIGWLMHRTWGGLMAGCLFVLPSLLILIGLSFAYMRFAQHAAMTQILYGIKPAIVAIVLFAAYRLGTRTLKNRYTMGIALFAFVALVFFKIPFPALILMAAAFGYTLHHANPALLTQTNAHESTLKQNAKALIDDHTPLPNHAHFSLKEVCRVLVFGLLLWGGAVSALVLSFGWQAMPTQMALFFTQAALLTFGGAYAVLPYVFQNAVLHFHWLNAAQMMDGLALGETTPGPLIMVVAYIGFVATWNQSHVANPLLAGAAMASLVTFFTFLPSFIFIFAGAPLIEASKRNLKLTAPMLAMNAAIVGVIASLALFLAHHVFVPKTEAHVHAFFALDWRAIGLMLVYLIALVRFKRTTIQVLIAAGLLGLLTVFF